MNASYGGGLSRPQALAAKTEAPHESQAHHMQLLALLARAPVARGPPAPSVVGTSLFVGPTELAVSSQLKRIVVRKLPLIRLLSLKLLSQHSCL